MNACSNFKSIRKSFLTIKYKVPRSSKKRFEKLYSIFANLILF